MVISVKIWDLWEPSLQMLRRDAHPILLEDSVCGGFTNNKESNLRE